MTTTTATPIPPFDDLSPPPMESKDLPTQSTLTLEERYDQEREHAKLRHWEESPYAVGLVEATWADELARMTSRSSSSSSSSSSRRPPQGPCGDCCAEEEDSMDPTCGCIKLSAIVCTKLGAKRVGNMAILNYSNETVEEEEEGSNEEGSMTDEEQQGVALTTVTSSSSSSSSSYHPKRKRMVFRQKIAIVVGPYWPMLVFITYPLILGVSFWTATTALPGMPMAFILFWCACTIGLCLSLFATGCRDPGIMLRRRTPPPTTEASRWRWNDQAKTWRPYGSVYDPDCACVVERFDHT